MSKHSFETAVKRFTASFSALVMIGTGVLGAAGCELIANVDRSKISDTSTTTGTGGAGGHGGATGTGGTAGHGGTGGTGGCTAAASCPGMDTDCQTRTCTEGVCGFDFAAKGTQTTDQQAGDCKTNVCDGKGGLTTENADGDILDDKNLCTDDTCKDGVPLNAPKTAGTACTGAGKEKLCDGTGTCVECVTGADCNDGVCEPMDGSCVPATCFDGVKNGDESDKDCGGSCGSCDTGKTCNAATDCTDGVCTGVCVAALCTDTVQNGAETDVDCGGGTCDPCGPTLKCSVDTDCVGNQCSGTVCVPNCTDLVKNDTESDVDCGGTCAKCPAGKICGVAADCADGVCENGLCVAAACDDTVKNGSETDVDCGGSCAPAKKCGDTKSCGVADDCLSGVCTGGVCVAPTCSDGVKNGLEGGLDCGAVCPTLCADASTCLGPGDCLSGVCSGGVCQPASCADTVKNGNETDVDCGGACAPAKKCADGKSCGAGGDCASGVCAAGICAIPACNDAVKNGNETDVDCGGSCAAKCGDGKICGGAGDCQSGVCTAGVCAAAVCGDGVKNGAEGCDDGNGAAGDGCTACVLDAGYACNNALPNVCTPICGDGLIKGAETCDDGNVVSGDCCSSACQIEAGCEVEPNDLCGASNAVPLAGSPATGTVSGLIKPIGDNDLYSFTLAAPSSVRLEVFIGGAGLCTAATNSTDAQFELRGPDCNTVLGGDDDDGPGLCPLIDPTVAADSFARALPANTYFVKVFKHLNSALINLYQLKVTVVSTCGNGVLEPSETCDQGGGNVASGDGCSSTCQIEPGFTCAGTPTVCTANCGNGALDAGELCDQGGGNVASGDGCSSTCQVEVGYICAGTPSVCVLSCGDGVINGGDQCDQGGGNVANGDGCSSTCQVEPNFQCAGTPSVCVPFETSCGDGLDNDGDSLIDNADDDCVVTVKFPPCAAGQIRKVFRSTDTPLAIPDSNAAGITSVINVAGAGATARASIVYNITHTFDADVDMFLTPPGGASTDICTDNGSSGVNFVNTVLDNTCSVNIGTLNTAASAPFSGCFKPENPIAVTSDGAWSLKVADDAGGDTGTLDNWAVILCTTVTCGNGVLDAGETCDQGGGVQVGGDGCSASCQVEAGFSCAGTPSVCTPNCGNGVIDAGEACDQGGGAQVGGDGCSAACQVEANFQCTGAPSACVPFETSCGDGLDNDGDSLIDNADDDCVVTLKFPPCAAGQTRKVFRSTDTPIAIPDDDPLGMFSTIAVAGAGTVTRAALVYNITHTFDSDLDIFVSPAGGASIDICTGNGGSGDNFIKTVLDNTCSPGVASGSAPFSSCFSPENAIATVGDGTWELDIADGFFGDSGTLDSWAVVLCTTP